MVAGGWWLVADWLMASGWWLLAGGCWLLAAKLAFLCTLLFGVLLAVVPVGR